MYRRVKSIILFCSVCCLFIPDLFAVKLDTAFWIAGSSGGVFDEATVRIMAKNSTDWIVLNFPTNGPGGDPTYCMKSNQARIRAVKSSLRTLNYCNKTLGGVDNGRISWSTLDNFTNQPRVRYPGTTLVITADGETFGDFSNTTYTTWFIGRVTNMIYKMNADGVAFDMSMHRDPFTAGLLNPKAVAEGAWRTNYIKGFDRATSNVHTCANSRNPATNNIVIYNGLTYVRGPNNGPPDTYQWMQCQQHLLSNYADGAIFEFFGCRDYSNDDGATYSMTTNSFAEIVTQVDAMTNMNAHGKRLMVFGRGKRTYVDYQEDYKWQQYLFGCYLLGAFNNHSFKYISSFQTTPSGRSEGLDQYADQFYVPANYLGSAEPYSKITSPSSSSGLYTRVFAAGRVLVNPHDSSGSKTYKNTNGITMYDRIGNTYANNATVNLAQGTAVLLLDNKLSSNNIGRYIDFTWTNSAGRNPVEMWSNAVVNAQTNLYCSAGAPEWMHDLMIFPVKHYLHQDGLMIRAHFRNTAAKVLVLCEVDDTNKVNDYVVFTIEYGTSPPGSTVTTDSRIIFRSPSTSLVAPYIPGAICTDTTSFQSLNINAGDRFATLTGSNTNRYTYKRWVFIRILGDVTIDHITVGTNKYYYDEDYYYDGP